jgi:hypothetical protein
MAFAESSVVVPAPVDQVWAVVSDLKNWDELTATHLMFSIHKVSFEMMDAPGPGARFKVSIGRNVLQAGVIQHWDPPRLLVIRAVSARPGFHQADAILAVALEPLSESSTEVALRLELDFTHPRFGGIVTRFFPLQSSINRCVGNVSEHLREMLARA